MHIHTGSSEICYIDMQTGYAIFVCTTHTLQMPHCENDKKISVSCLDLCYSVKLRRREEFKDEKKDETNPLVLHGLVEEEEEEGEEGSLAGIVCGSAQVCLITYKPAEHMIIL